MKRKNVRAILADSKKRKTILQKSCIIAIVIICALPLLFNFTSRNKKHYVTYEEEGKADYKVFVKENNFYNTQALDSSKEYVTSLIDYINTYFTYQLKMNEADVNYCYSYRAEAVVDITMSNNQNSLYTFSENIVEEEINKTSNTDVDLNRSAKVDYNKYNEIASSFIKLYELKDKAKATLTINFYVDVAGNSKALESDIKNQNVYSLSMPLNEITINVSESSDVKDKEDLVIACKSTESPAYFSLALFVILTILAIERSFNLAIFINKNRSAETIYEKELRKILNNYGSYIQKVNNGYDLENNKVLEVDTFYDMLEIRETIQEPIIMVENYAKTETYFMILGKMNIIYVYRIRVSDIRKAKNVKLKRKSRLER